MEPLLGALKEEIHATLLPAFHKQHNLTKLGSQQKDMLETCCPPNPSEFPQGKNVRKLQKIKELGIAVSGGSRAASQTFCLGVVLLAVASKMRTSQKA